MHSLTDSSPVLIIQENAEININNFQVKIDSHLGHFTDIHYFKVIINSEIENDPKTGLLRIGSIDGGLHREMELRQNLGDHKMVSELLAAVTKESIKICFPAQESNTENKINMDIIADEAINKVADREENKQPENTISEELAENYLEEEYYDLIDISTQNSTSKLLVLTEIPTAESTLENWLNQENSLEESLLLASQVCQFFRYVYQSKWCFISILPNFIQMSKPIQFFDLTGAYKAGEKLNFGVIGDYSPPEVAYGREIDEQMSSYIVGILLYQALHQKLPPRFENITTPIDSLKLEVKPIPRISQILHICLSALNSDRFSLAQLLSLLVETRQSLRQPKINWDVAARSTLGLSASRLQNEDSYGIRQQISSTGDSWILGVVADGMGGMAQGEVASNLAVQTVLETTINTDLNTAQKRDEWLVTLVSKANEVVSSQVRDGGTTLSIVFVLGKELAIAHVGDSRIFLFRKNQICQLSEDHSMVAMLFANGQISYEESIEHPDRNVLIKSLGSKKFLSPGYVQTLSFFGSDFCRTLDNGDILILCSDGIWDLVPPTKLSEIFSNTQNLQTAVDQIIDNVLAGGAHDNATILALKYCEISSIQQLL